VGSQFIDSDGLVKTRMKVEAVDKVPVELLGSYVKEEKIATALSVAAGAEVYAVGSAGTDSACSEFSIGVYNTDNTQVNVTVRSWPVFAGSIASATGADTLINNAPLSNARGVSTPIKPKTNKVSIRLKNEDTTNSKTFDVYIFRFYNARG
jgi:hypothetical protein